jgi:predicted nucleic-acid-binding Zn-ribbon protein
MTERVTGCPRCSNTDTYRKLIPAAGESFNVLPGVGHWFSSTMLWVHVCGQCGHMEFSVPHEHLAKVREKHEAAPF